MKGDITERQFYFRSMHDRYFTSWEMNRSVIYKHKNLSGEIILFVLLVLSVNLRSRKNYSHHSIIVIPPTENRHNMRISILVSFHSQLCWIRNRKTTHKARFVSLIRISFIQLDYYVFRLFSNPSDILVSCRMILSLIV